jgi:hypothetical protein
MAKSVRAWLIWVQGKERFVGHASWTSEENLHKAAEGEKNKQRHINKRYANPIAPYASNWSVGSRANQIDFVWHAPGMPEDG